MGAIARELVRRAEERVIAYQRMLDEFQDGWDVHWPSGLTRAEIEAKRFEAAQLLAFHKADPFGKD